MVNMIALPISALCFLGWMLALGPDGEYMERVITTPERIADVEGRAAEFENFMRSHSPWGR